MVNIYFQLSVLVAKSFKWLDLFLWSSFTIWLLKKFVGQNRFDWCLFHFLLSPYFQLKECNDSKIDSSLSVRRRGVEVTHWCFFTLFSIMTVFPPQCSPQCYTIKKSETVSNTRTLLLKACVSRFFCYSSSVAVWLVMVQFTLAQENVLEEISFGPFVYSAVG